MSEAIRDNKNTEPTRAEWIAWALEDSDTTRTLWQEAVTQAADQGDALVIVDEITCDPAKIYLGSMYAALARKQGPDSPQARRALAMLADLEGSHSLPATNEPFPPLTGTSYQGIVIE